jgi:hypothetical protein
MPFIPKSTGIPTVDKVFKEVFAILNRFQGGKVASSSDEPVDWADIVNKPTTFPPESHTQDISTINNLQTTLDSKEPVIVLGTGNKYLFRDKTWKEIDWSEIINKPSTYSPTSHIHAIADITSLQTTLDDKQPVHANLTSISNLSTTPSGRFLVTNGSAIVARPLQNSDLPAIAITDTFVVASQSAMLALSAAERGDVAVRTDLNKSFILKGDNPASLSDWQELLTPTDAVLSVDGRTGVVSLADKYQPLDSDLTAIAGLTHSNRHVLISNGTNWTRRALAEDDLPSLSISKITGLQTALDSKEPAITGTANKVLSIQTGGTGVKTGSITDNGTSAFFNNSFVGQASAVAKHYHDVLSYDGIGSITGAMKIVMPKTWSNTMMTIVIKGYTYIDNNINGWECRINGYNYISAWNRYSATIIGNAPFSQVRLAHDGTKCIILLGNTSTVWDYPKLTVSEMLACHQNTDGWETGWNASIIQSETGIGNVVTPTTSIYGNIAVIPNTALIGKTTATGGYRLEVEGHTLISGILTAGWVTASSGADITTLQIQDKIQLLNKARTGWLDFVTRDVSGSEAAANLSNVARLNDMNVYESGFYRNDGNISIYGDRVNMSRRNVGGAAIINITTNPQIIDLNDYPRVSRFDITTSMAGAPIVYFKNAIPGDEIFVKIVKSGPYPSEYDMALGWNIDPGDGTWMRYATKRYFHLICEGTATAGGITANTWWIAGVHGLYQP